MPDKLKPMLAAKLTEETMPRIRLPVFASPKIDGIRCLTTRKGPVSRNLKPIRNEYLQKVLHKLPNGFDGELIIPDGTFTETTSAVMSADGDASKIEYWVFDVINNKMRNWPFIKRYNVLCDFVRNCAVDMRVVAVPQVLCNTLKEALKLEQLWLKKGFEGIMLRDVNGVYKYGRSTVREQGLMKFKRFTDSEAKVLGYFELQHNENKLEADELGRAKRSAAKVGKIGARMLGGIHVRDLKTKVEFDIGTGFGNNQRKAWWKRRDWLIGKIVRYRFQASGMKDKPRFPVFTGIRDQDDM